MANAPDLNQPWRHPLARANMLENRQNKLKAAIGTPGGGPNRDENLMGHIERLQGRIDRLRGTF